MTTDKNNLLIFAIEILKQYTCDYFTNYDL